MRISRAVRFQMYLASHPRAANRLLGLMGTKRAEAAGRQAAIKAARAAYEHVPFYHDLYEQHGFTAARMQQLTWEDFQQLPQVSKDITENVNEMELLDDQLRMPRDDAQIGRSSGTLHAPVHWPMGWSEFYLTRSAFEAIVRGLGADVGAPTAVVVTNAVEGGDQSGNVPYRTFFSLKEQMGWNMEIIATGEDSATVHSWLRWLARQGYTSLLMIIFPGSLVRLLDYIATLPASERVDWDAFQHKHILMGGQLVARQIRERLRQEMRLDPASLTSESIIYVSSDTGQLMARSTPFTLWLERYLDQHPELYPALGLATEHQTKPFLEFLPPLSIQFEFDHSAGLLVTLAKHRPLIRYKIGDLVWSRRIAALTDVLNQITPTWRRDFQHAGGGPLDIPRVATLGVVLGRADEICIVNAANVSPAMVQQALEKVGIAPQIRHFKHMSDPARPNEYHLYLELTEPQPDEARLALADQWHAPLLAALLNLPAASDLLAAHRTNPIEFFLAVRSPGADEFQGDDGLRKQVYVLRTPSSARLSTQA